MKKYTYRLKSTSGARSSMMQTIWKYPIGTIEKATIQMPQGAQVLSVQVQRVPTIWALIPDVDAVKFPRTFRTYCTGHQHETIGGRYVGTYQLDGGAFVFHVFEEPV